MFVSTPTDENPLLQEWMFLNWMCDVDYSTVVAQARDGLERIIKREYSNYPSIIGHLIVEYDMMINEYQ